MEQELSKKLKGRLMAYFKSNYKIEITSEQAEIYLDSLADFYIVVSRKEKRLKDTF